MKIKKIKLKKASIKRFTVLTSILIIACSPFLFFFIYFINRAYPNIYINGINVSGKTEAEISNLLDPELNTPKGLVLTYNDNKFTIPVSSLEIKIDKEKTIKEALKLGRNGNTINDIIEITSIIRAKRELNLLISLNKDALNSSISEISKKIAIPPIDAKFTMSGGKIQTFLPESNGLKVDEEELKNEILNLILKNTSNEIVLNIPVKPDYAETKASDINNLGIDEIIGSGTSHFTGSIGSRIYNINLAASRLNNTLIAPGEVFSFDNAVGDISALSGYQQAYVIENGRTVLGDGGGVCQVSTTIFRAALNSGLPIVERHAHAYRVHYYEQDSDPGMDATIYTPSVDLKFKNDTSNHILIQTQIDLKNLVLTFNFYGRKDGRTIQISKPTLWGYEPPPSDLYIDDPTLPLGQIKQIDWKASGIKSQFEYVVTKDGQEINRQLFYSNFEPWQAKFLRGTKI